MPWMCSGDSGVFGSHRAFSEIRLTVYDHGRAKKGAVCFFCDLSRWLRQIMTLVYSIRGWVPPFHVTAHSTWLLIASGAFHHQASAALVCKAATWSLVYTVTKFYNVAVLASEDASFGRTVLQAAVLDGLFPLEGVLFRPGFSLFLC